MRGLGGGRMADFGLGSPTSEYVKDANREMLVCVLIEDVAAVENLDEILGVPDIDVFFIGPTDLARSTGHPGRQRTPGRPEGRAGRVRPDSRGRSRLWDPGRCRTGAQEHRGRHPVPLHPHSNFHEHVRSAVHADCRAVVTSVIPKEKRNARCVANHRFSRCWGSCHWRDHGRCLGGREFPGFGIDPP
ncbi:MAG: hypothetical protein IH960_03905 [Chloroflexi bacterium]|nr:hypothetical protein [Chloroflexota bacterium]